MTTIIRAEAAHDFLALVPSLAGFRPQRSLVCVAFSGNRTSGVLRHDLPRRPRDRAPLVAAIVGTLCRMPGVDAVVPIVYTDARFDAARGLPQRALLDALAQRAEQAGFLVRDALCVAADAWGSLLDPRLPVEGHPLSLIDESPLAVQAATTRAIFDTPSGSAKLPQADAAAARDLATALGELTGDDREAMLAGLGENADPVTLVEALLAPGAEHPPVLLAWFVHLASLPAMRDAMMLQFAFGTVIGEAALDDAVETAERAEGLGETVDELVVRELAESAPGEISMLLSNLMMGQSSVRPDVGRVERALALLPGLIANAPATHRVGPLCIAAWLAWSLGRGSAAGAFIDLAIDLDPGHSMAGLLAGFIGSGAVPDWVFSAP